MYDVNEFKADESRYEAIVLSLILVLIHFLQPKCRGKKRINH